MPTWSNENPTARKQHLCDDCCRTIEPGEKYWRLAIVGDDGLNTWKMCAQCDVLRQLIREEDPDSFDPEGGLVLGEWLFDNNQPRMLALYRGRWKSDDGLVSVSAISLGETT